MTAPPTVVPALWLLQIKTHVAVKNKERDEVLGGEEEWAQFPKQYNCACVGRAGERAIERALALGGNEGPPSAPQPPLT